MVFHTSLMILSPTKTSFLKEVFIFWKKTRKNIGKINIGCATLPRMTRSGFLGLSGEKFHEKTKPLKTQNKAK